jgi:acetyltransferase-like isoleucine patch superfamily enzyme
MAILRKVVAHADRQNRDPYQLIAHRFFGLTVGRMSYGFDQLFGEHVGSVGAFCSIAPGLKIGGFEHPLEYVSTHPFLFYKNRGIVAADRRLDDRICKRNAKVRIGNDGWIGEGVKILSGVTICDGAVVGANSVVTKDVEPYSVVAGNPAKLIRYRFDVETRRRVAASCWWLWTDEEIKRRLPEFYVPNLFCLEL